jgi:hypothetical protein
MIEWFAWSSEPSIWFSFVAVDGPAGAVMRGLSFA